MARKIANRKELRAEAEAAERQEAEEKPKAKRAAAKTTPRKKTTRTRAKKVVKEVRLKAFWGVFNQSLRRVALFEYSQRDQAQKKAEALSASGKIPHFVQRVKEVIEE